MSEVITCPSGLTGRIRGMKVAEERILADRRLAKDGGQLDALIRACWEETIDFGPYPEGPTGLSWDQVLQGDRFFILMRIRAQTYGPLYAFTVPCQSQTCRARIEWEFDLGALHVKPLEGENRERFLAGNRFETVLPDAQTRVAFRLMTGADERKLHRLRKANQEQVLSSLIAFRLVEAEGVESRHLRKWVEDLAMADARFLLDAFEDADCGVETSIEIECPECFTVQRVELPFDQSFFLPTRTNRPQASSRR